LNQFGQRPRTFDFRFQFSDCQASERRRRATILNPKSAIGN
jgi:hypothetical protein